ncbi:hypothetical protein CONLIGDRAFT_706522 [Coniochaeta ligniaria NRRL 30616]|uniref:F-box domain-containing protein n=1 Tax=Coniochaeta ligniaria NRRL 30616 TaxID=1408157 RepID=A0A1J7J976_9PEZI|nr:hypothetical protein CONLIGDRAFT_706522 [Coniochaeta ligniaria NRRL 30616]
MARAQARSSVDPGQLQSENDAIVRVTTFHRVDGFAQVWGYDLDSQMPRHVNHLYRPSWPRPTPLSPKGTPMTGLGVLEILPVEILHEVVSQFTIRQAMRFRSVNHRARQVVDNMLEYRAVTRHARACFEAILETRMSDTLRFADVFRAMCMQQCEKCNRAGQYIHLPTLTRCCLPCLELDPSLRTVRLSHFTEIDQRTLRKQVRVVLAHPRPYMYVYINAPDEAKLSRRVNMTDYETAKEVVERVKGTAITGNEPQSQRSFTVSCPLPLYNKSAQTSYWALSCKGCARVRPRQDPTRVNEEFTREGFLEHFQKCEEAQRLWAASEGSTRDIGHLDNYLIRNRGLKPNGIRI